MFFNHPTWLARQLQGERESGQESCRSSLVLRLLLARRRRKWKKKMAFKLAKQTKIRVLPIFLSETYLSHVYSGMTWGEQDSVYIVDSWCSRSNRSLESVSWMLNFLIVNFHFNHATLCCIMTNKSTWTLNYVCNVCHSAHADLQLASLVSSAAV